jgi:uncharacterized repeat protein (TIGR01451 family)
VKSRLLVHSLLLSIVLTIGLVTLSGTLLLVATPLLLYLLGSWLLRPDGVDLRVDRRVSRRRANPNEPIDVSILVENRGDPLPEVVVRDQLPPGMRVIAGSPATTGALPTGERIELAYTITGSRGSYRFKRITVEIAGDLPLRARGYGYDLEHELVMLPDHRALSRIPIAPRRTLVYAGTNPARQGGEGTEFFDVREHRPGESLRHVNWRASARRQHELFVNEYQQERVADVAILLDCRLRSYPPGAVDTLFDAAASAAASLADALLDTGNRVGYLGYGLSLDWLAPGFGRVQKHRILNRIARTRPGESHVFSRLDAVPERLFPPGSQVVVVTPLGADDPPDIERLQAYGYAVMVVAPDPVALQRPVREGQEPDRQWGGTDPAMRDAERIVRLQRRVLLRRLRHAGIAVIDWQTAQPFEDAVARSLGGILAAWRRRRR